MNEQLPPEQGRNTAENHQNTPARRAKRGAASKKFAIRGQAGYSLARKPRPAARLGDGKGKYFRIWYVELRKPGAGRLDTSSSTCVEGGAEICATCLAVDRPALNRPGCVCQAALRRAIEAELAAAVTAFGITMRENRVEQYTRLHHVPKPKAATARVQDIIDAVEGVRDPEGGWKLLPGLEIWDTTTWRVYKAALKRVARLVCPTKPESALLAEVLTQKTVERLQCAAQGVESVRELNLLARLDCNGGVNSVLRNLKSMFTVKACQRLFSGLALPGLEEFRGLPTLPTPVTGFVPWPAEDWAKFVKASDELLEADPVLWRVNAFLRRTGMRDEELLLARRRWVEEVDGKPVLVIKDRGAESSLLKHGKGRRIGLCDELWAVVKNLEPDAFLIGEGLAPSRRSNLIYRDHCAFVRQFIPKRRKANHELRMMAGSLIYALYGLEKAADFLGHKSLDTTRNYYATALGASEPLTGKMVNA